MQSLRRWIPLAMLPGAVGVLACIAALAGDVPAAGGASVPSGPHRPRVLRVGTYHGMRGQFSSIQAAANAARPGDWILIAPGDYKTHTSEIPSNSHGQFPAAVLLTKPGVYLRGMNRNSVIVDGTTAGPPCNHVKADQNFGPRTKKGPAGLNGIMVWKANNVWVQNLTACNFLGGSGGDGATGNEIWWNGGANEGGYKKVYIGGHGYLGSYLTATSTWYDSAVSPAKAEVTAAEYGIFSSNWRGGTWDHAYASNFNDSGYYIGACGQQCNQIVDHVWSQWNDLGYSGSNSGDIVIENSQWDHNDTGVSTNSQEGDNPPPQNGACPKGVRPPVRVKGALTCWVMVHNYVHDNNDPNVPQAGLSAGGPVGTGLSLAGARNDTVIGNRFVRNNAWGIANVPFPGSGPPCTGGVLVPPSYTLCIWDGWGDALIGNTFTRNGSYGNLTNGDFGVTSFFADPTDCFARNKDTRGPLTATPSDAQTAYPKCNGTTVPPMVLNPQSLVFTYEVACDSNLQFPITGKTPCAPTDHYPRPNWKDVHNGLHPLPSRRQLPTMPNPCAGVPKNPWCP